MKEEREPLLDADVIFGFNSERIFKHICEVISNVERSSIKLEEDGIFEISLKLRAYRPKIEELKLLCAKLANEIISNPKDTINAFTDLFIRWRYRSNLCAYARLYDGKFKTRKQANLFAIRFVYALLKRNLIRVNEPDLLANLAKGHFPSNVTIKDICIFHGYKRSGFGENISLSVNLRKLAEEGFYEVFISDATLRIFSKERTLSLMVESYSIPRHSIIFDEKHGKVIMNMVSQKLASSYFDRILICLRSFLKVIRRFFYNILDKME
ncbi:MAG: hypothetical protein ACP5IT_09620 [Thermoproteota archaeon]